MFVEPDRCCRWYLRLEGTSLDESPHPAHHPEQNVYESKTKSRRLGYDRSSNWRNIVEWITIATWAHHPEPKVYTNKNEIQKSRPARQPLRNADHLEFFHNTPKKSNISTGPSLKKIKEASLCESRDLWKPGLSSAGRCQKHVSHASRAA